MRILVKIWNLVGAILILSHWGYALTCKVTPKRVNIDLFYHGERVIVTGETASDTNILVKISSPEDAEIFMKKGKVKGIFWMNVEKLIFKGIPQVYFTYSSDDDLDGHLNEKEKQKWGVGYQILEKSFTIPSIKDPLQKDVLFKELIKFKQNEHLWGRFKDKVRFSPLGEKKKVYKLVIDWPPNIPPNVYSVDVYAMKNGVVVDHAQSSIEVRKIGIEKTLSTLAEKNGALYGIISILVALGAGVITGVIFKKK